MGTFHHDAHPLHGITCAVDTTGPRVFVGRVDFEDARGLVLLDVDVFDEAPGAGTKADWLRRVALVGPWKRHEHVVVPRSEIASVTRLADVATA